MEIDDMKKFITIRLEFYGVIVEDYDDDFIEQLFMYLYNDNYTYNDIKHLDTKLFYLLALGLLDSSNYEEAIYCFEDLIDRGELGVYKYLAHCYYSEGLKYDDKYGYDKADKYYELALRYDPNDEETRQDYIKFLQNNKPYKLLKN